MSANKQYDSVPVAKYLLALAVEKGINLNATQLQKLLFIFYGIILSKTKISPLTETPKAWPYGPVFPRVQKHVSLNQIYSLSDNSLSEIKSDKLVSKTLADVIEQYSNNSAGKLTNWSHKEGGPWELTVRNEGIKSQPIPDAYILDYFNKYEF